MCNFEYKTPVLIREAKLPNDIDGVWSAVIDLNPKYKGAQRVLIVVPGPAFHYPPEEAPENLRAFIIEQAHRIGRYGLMGAYDCLGHPKRYFVEGLTEYSIRHLHTQVVFWYTEKKEL